MNNSESLRVEQYSTFMCHCWALSSTRTETALLGTSIYIYVPLSDYSVLYRILCHKVVLQWVDRFPEFCEPFQQINRYSLLPRGLTSYSQLVIHKNWSAGQKVWLSWKIGLLTLVKIGIWCALYVDNIRTKFEIWGICSCSRIIHGV